MKKNPNSPIRSGYHYEDLFTLKLFVDWLLNPKTIQSIRIQYTPENINIRHFSIDDIVVEKTDGSIDFYQIKHIQNPNTDLWDFEKLRSKGLYKWINSFNAINYSLKKCYLITNGELNENLSLVFKNKKIDLDRLIEINPKFSEELNTKYPLKSELEYFFQNFIFNNNELNKDELEDKLRNILYKDLKVTKAGVDNLLLFISKQGSEKFPVLFDLKIIRSKLSWDNPRPLNQKFDIPIDFEFFDKSTHNKILKDLNIIEGGIKIITGKPGSGKSTYLSKLYNSLKDKNKIVFRHHYHLSPNDTNYLERLNSERVIEGFKAEFKKLSNDIIEKLGEINTKSTKLIDFINKISTYCYSRNETFILIIDGLDHVIRESNKESELIDFLNEILYPQNGFWLILGTQETATELFPNNIQKISPKEKWMEIKGLNRESVKKILIKSFYTEYKKDKKDFEKIVNELYLLTSGNPLHLRYIITELKNNDLEITNYDLDKLPHYNNDIENYYNSLWKQIPPIGKTITFALTTLDFNLFEEQLFSLANNFCKYPYEITESYNKIKHLFNFKLSGISVYHNSFQVFVLKQEELNQQKILLYNSLKIWLKEDSQESLAWSELPKIEYYLGNSEKLLSIDDKWIIDNYLKNREEYLIENTLYLAKKASFEKNDFNKCIYFHILYNSFINREYNLGDALSDIWVTSYKVNNNSFIKYPNFSILNEYQLKEIIIALINKNVIYNVPNEARERINELFINKEFDQTEIIYSCLEIFSQLDKIKINEVFKFIIQFRNNNTPNYFRFYIDKCLKLSRDKVKRIIIKLLKYELLHEEKEAIGEALVFNDFKNINTFFEEEIIILLDNPNSYLISLYNILLKNENIIDNCYLINNLSDDLQYYEAKKVIQSNLKTNFFYSYINNYNNNNPNNNYNSSNIWLHELSEIINDISINLKSNSKIEFNNIISKLNKLEEISFYNNRILYEYYNIGIPYLINNIIWLSSIINRNNNYEYYITSDEVSQLLEFKFYNKITFIEAIKNNFLFISEDTLNHFVEFELIKDKSEIIPFRDKAKYLSDLATITYDYGYKKDVKSILDRAAQNILSYGYHKDMLLYNIIESIDCCIEANSSRSIEFLEEIYPYVYNIKELTDGDETNHFIDEFCKLLAKVKHPLLFNLYNFYIKELDYISTDNRFDDILLALDYNCELSQAIAKTSIGSNIKTLNKLKKSNKAVIPILKELTDKFGIDENYENKIVDDDFRENFNELEAIKLAPKDLKKHLFENKSIDSIRIEYQDSTFIDKWIKSRLSKYPNEDLIILKEVKLIVRDKLNQINYKLLDTLFELAIKSDRNFAYECICWAQSNSNAWHATFFYSMENSKKRWRLLIDNFPEKIDDFYKTSVKNSGLHYRNNETFEVSVPKSTQFFIDTNKLDKAEDITHSYINSLKHIFPNVVLTIPNAFQSKNEISLFDLLTSRLTWLSPIVRESAASEIANLLVYDKEGKYHSSYIKYINEMSIENRLCEALLVLIMSLQNSNSYSYKYLTIEIITDLGSIRSMATDLLMLNICNSLGIKYKTKNLLFTHVSLHNTNLLEDDFYKILSKSLPSIFYDYLENLQINIDENIILWKVWYSL